MRAQTIFFLSMLLFTHFGFLEAASLKNSRPNIIIVMTDDQGLGDLSCMGNPVLKTDNLDSFYNQSTRFTDFHVSPSCSPTRAALLSGRHEFRNGVTLTVMERERMSLDTTTFPDLLSRNGYQTGIFGKWHLGDEDEYQPYNRGFTEVFIHGAGGIGQYYDFCSCGDFPPNQDNPYFDNVILHNDTIVQTKGYCTDVFFHAALGWIKKQKAKNTPFFAYIATNTPHSPRIAPDKYAKRFLDLGYDKNTAGFYGMVENIDHNFGLMISKLEEWKLMEDTLVIFMTDNGQAPVRPKLNGKSVPGYNAGFKSGKGSAYEGGTHVPAFWRWDGVLGKGVDIPALTAHIDLFKTFCELTGTEITNDVQDLDGRSLLPLLENPGAEWKDRYLIVHRGRWGREGEVTTEEERKYGHHAIRTKRWRFVDNKELYDISNDPYESTNVATDYPEVIEELRKVYDQWWLETVPLMVNEDVPMLSIRPQEVRYNKQLKEKGIPDWIPPEI
ncbi:MAG: arylsulfatase [Puniceicoccaceae bacterium]